MAVCPPNLIGRLRRLVLVGVVLNSPVMLPSLGGSTYAQGSPAAISVVQHPELGAILVGPNGMTLYYLVTEEAGTIKCEEDCAANWPPLLTSPSQAASPELEGQLGSADRSRLPDGAQRQRLVRQTQVTYNGHPLYYWSRDEAPGDVSGHGIGDIWFVARP